MPKNNKPNTKRTSLFLGIFLVLIVLLVVILTSQNNPQNPLSFISIFSNESKDVGIVVENSRETPLSGSPNNTKPPPNEQVVPTGDLDKSQNNNSNTQNTNSNATSGYAVLNCSRDLSKVCVIGKDNNLFSALGKSFDSEMLVNGVKVKPEKILYITSNETYSDEQIKDGQGKVITSSNKTFDSSTSTLTLTVSIGADYYKNLSQSERNLLYTSQTVRSFMAMFEESPENFIKAEQIVSSLGSWQPTQ